MSSQHRQHYLLHEISEINFLLSQLNVAFNVAVCDSIEISDINQYNGY